MFRGTGDVSAGQFSDFGNSPYADDALGTIDSFNKMTAADIAAFYKTWYHLNDATLVIAGDIDPVATLAQIHQLFDPIPAVPLPAHKTGAIAPFAIDRIQANVALGGSFSMTAQSKFRCGHVAAGRRHVAPCVSAEAVRRL